MVHNFLHYLVHKINQAVEKPVNKQATQPVRWCCRE